MLGANLVFLVAGTGVRARGRCVAVGRRRRARRAADRGRRTACGADVHARRYRDPARAGLENLLALSGRLRHSAALRFRALAECEIRDGALSGAAAASPTRAAPRSATRTASCFRSTSWPQDRRQARHAAPDDRLRGVRKDLHSGRRQGRADAHAASRRARRDALSTPRRWCPKPAVLGAGERARDPRGEARGRASVIVDVAAPADAAVELFAEGPSADWALPVPSRRSRAPGGPAALRVRARRIAARRQAATARPHAHRGRRRAAIEVPYRLD